MHRYYLMLPFLRGMGSTGTHQGQVWPPPWLRRHQHLYPLPINPFRGATVWFFTRVNCYGSMLGGEPPFLFLWDSSWTHCLFPRYVWELREWNVTTSQATCVGHSCSLLERDLLENLAQQRHRWPEVCGAQPVKGKIIGACQACAKASHTLIEMGFFLLRSSESLHQASVRFCLQLLRDTHITVVTAEHKSLPWGGESFSIWSMPGIQKCH